MNSVIMILIGLFLTLVSACSSIPFVSTELTSTVPRSVASLSEGLWCTGNGSLMIRHTALFEFEGASYPLTGIMKFDRSAKVARLVGMNDMGVKLFDVSVDAVSSHAHFIIQDLTHYPNFAEAVAVSLRRIFLTYVPVSNDTLERTTTKYLITRDNAAGDTIQFILGGSDEQLLEKLYRGSSESWRVRYYQYQRLQGNLFPGGIVLDDNRAGYRLTLWIESVEKTDE